MKLRVPVRGRANNSTRNMRGGSLCVRPTPFLMPPYAHNSRPSQLPVPQGHKLRMRYSASAAPPPRLIPLQYPSYGSAVPQLWLRSTPNTAVHRMKFTMPRRVARPKFFAKNRAHKCTDKPQNKTGSPKTPNYCALRENYATRLTTQSIAHSGAGTVG